MKTNLLKTAIPPGEFVHLTQSRLRHKQKNAKKEQNFELSPPRCGNCKYFTPAVQPIQKKNTYKSPICGLGGFNIFPKSICDSWVGKDGATIED
jgi:hypothetical protein